MTHTLPPLPATNAELCEAVFPFTVADHDYTLVGPGCVLDHSQGGGMLTVSITRLAIALGMPPQEFATPGSPGNVPATLLDHVMLEVLGLKSEWWDGLWPSEEAHNRDIPDTLHEMAERALDWLNGTGLTDVPTTQDEYEDCWAHVRCDPEYRDTHYYEVCDSSLYLWPNDEETP